MKLFSSFVLLIVFLAQPVSYSDSTYYAPSYYYTLGNYSNNNSSNSHAVYLTSYLGYRFTLNNHYELLNINISKDWDYTQHTFLGGGLINYYPYFYKFYYSYKRGVFSKNNNDIYTDHSNLFSLEAMYYHYLYYFGLHYTFANANGILNIDSLNKQQVHQITGRIDHIFSPSVYLSIRPNVSILSDGRNLYSVAGKATCFLYPSLAVKVNGFVGRRAYYFDSDILTIFNQDETQQYQAGIQIDYYPFYHLLISAGYQNTKFQSYKINYFVAGLRYGFFL